jgi:ADP-heptose:LPS heptosyltransferase
MHPHKKILVIRFSSIGDIVLTTPVVRCLKQQLSGAEVHFLTKNQYLPLLKENPYIDKIHIINNKVTDILEDLKAEDYDFVVDLHKNLRSSRVKMALGVESGTFNKLNKKKWLLTNLKMNLLPKIHIVDRYFGAVKKLNVHNDGQGLDYFIPANEMISLSDYFPDEFLEGYNVLVVGSKQQTKQMPVEKMLEFCFKTELPVVLLGDKSDSQKAEQISGVLGEKVFNGCGVFTLNQSASVILQAKVVVTPDTGLMHIASALKKKIISVWGNTVPDFGMYPYFPTGQENYHIVEVLGLPCRPCSKLGYKQCPKKHFRCMMDIDVDEILKMSGELTDSSI